MKYQIMSKSSKGNYIAVASVEATTPEEAVILTANFCAMTGVEVAGVKPANIPTVVWENAPQAYKLG